MLSWTLGHRWQWHCQDLTCALPVMEQSCGSGATFYCLLSTEKSSDVLLIVMDGILQQMEIWLKTSFKRLECVVRMYCGLSVDRVCRPSCWRESLRRERECRNQRM